MSSRRYSSPLREQQAQRTRAAILDALTDLLGAHPADEVSTKQIAQRAGVSEPTVYRHFPDRAALVEALGARIEERSGQWDATASPTIEEWATWISKGFRAADEHAIEATAEAVLNADPRRFSPSSRRRTADLVELAAASFPELSDRDRVRIAALLRTLGSVQTWLRMREEFGVSGSEAGETVRWAITTLTREIRDGHTFVDQQERGEG